MYDVELKPEGRALSGPSLKTAGTEAPWEIPEWVGATTDLILDVHRRIVAAFVHLLYILWTLTDVRWTLGASCGILVLHIDPLCAREF